MDLYKKIAEDWTDELNREFRRGKYPTTKLNVDWFTAIDGANGVASTTSRQDKKADSPTPEARFRTAINDIP